MTSLEAVDQVEILILVDNVTDNLSSTPVFVETEIAALGRRRRGAWVLAGTAAHSTAKDGSRTNC